MSDSIKHRPENEKQKAAFEHYYGLGYKRKYAAVAEKYEVSIRTVKNWSRLYNWRKRIDRADKASIATLRLSLASDGADEIERLLKITQLMKSRALKGLAGAKQKPTLSELISLIKTRLDLQEQLNDFTGRKTDGFDSHVVIYDNDK